ncbi:MAG: ROK family protein [Candidatus Aminicenantes bacterium]|nr:ROK family protein [Candidatus Aminicenantes bacterium]
MKTDLDEAARPKVAPPLHADFIPAVLWNKAFRAAADADGRSVPLVLGLMRSGGSLSRYETAVFPPGHPSFESGLRYAERLIKSLLWMWGACRVIVGGPGEVGNHIRKAYSRRGDRAFDAALMSAAYGKKFSVEVTAAGSVPPALEKTRPLGRHLEGCRIGFDLGASDRKVSAVIDGEAVFSEEVAWDPRHQDSPLYHYHQIMSGLHQAASHLPRVEGIGGSAAGIYIDNRAMVASLFRGIPPADFKKRIQPMFLRLGKEWNVPFEVVNDGEVTALAGSMSLNANRVLGIALGSSQAGGYVNDRGNITGRLNELAFVPVDLNPAAPLDEWSGDAGCGVQYFSQQAAFRLAAKAGLGLADDLPAVDKLKVVQEHLHGGDERARLVFETIGVYLGYGIAHYADYYDIAHALILGRVTSGEAGPIILERARHVLKAEFPALFAGLTLHLPDEESRRIGQAVAAASLPVIERNEKRNDHGLETEKTRE